MPHTVKSLRLSVTVLALAWVAAGVVAGRLATLAWNSVVDYQPPYRFAEGTPPGERLDWRAILVVVDGLRYDASLKMRGLDRFRMQGAELSATAGIPSYSRPGRANLVTGAPPEVHGATTNLHERTLAIDNLFRGVARTNGRVAIAGSDLWRSLFGPDLKEAWVLESPLHEAQGQFDRVASQMLSFEWQAMRAILQQKATIGVLDLVVPDYAAHEYGAKSPQYARALFETDRVIGALADEADLWRTLVVVTADHGHLDEGGHGGTEPEVLTTPLVLAGRGVRLGSSGRARQIDVAPTIAALLGLPIPAGSEGRVLSWIFDPADAPPGFQARATAQQAAYVKDVAASLGVAGASSLEAARAQRLAIDHRARAPLVIATGALAWALYFWLAWPRKGPVLVAALAGAFLYEGAFRLLVARQGIRLSLSAINHEEDLGPYFARILMLSAVAMLVALAVVVLAASRLAPGSAAPLGLAAVFGAGLFLGAGVLGTWSEQGLFMTWRIGDLGWSFGAFRDLVRLQAVGYSAALVLPLAWLPSRRVLPAVALLAMLTASPVQAAGGAILGDVPERPDPNARYLIYLHGRIVELQGRAAASPEFGSYEYDAILQALAAGGQNVVSELRGPSTGFEYATRVAAQVRKLMGAGVPPDHVSVLGFSKGGYLARAAAAELGDSNVRFVVLAGCPKQASELEPWVARMKGRMLSVYDAPDTIAGSCQTAFQRAPGVAGRELVLTLGKGHGAFYAPRKEWLGPVLEWLSH
jgi:hypothetical protein